MKKLIIIAAAAFSISGTTASADVNQNNVRVQPGFFCANNKCVRFAQNLQTVEVGGRRPVSVTSYQLAQNPVISGAEYKQIFLSALRADPLNTSR